MGAAERITLLVDEESFQETDASMSAVDPLGFKGLPPTRSASPPTARKPVSSMP